MFALVDCNNFYCSCERVFNPKLEGRPVIVLSNNDGCAIARSDEAKALGIAMAAPAFIMSKFIEKHQVTVLSSNYTLYGDMSRRIMDSLTFFASKIETYSIDEAFLDLGQMRHSDCQQLGGRIRQMIRKNLGIPVSVGMAATKTLAKMANRHAKKYYKKASVFSAGNQSLVDEMLCATPVADIWGIGHQYALLLSRSGFKTAADFLRAPEDWVRQHLSVVGQRLLFELRGIAAVAWEEKKPARKNICTSRSFGNRISDINKMAEAMANYAASCAAKLRTEKTCCRSLQVFIQTNPHKTEERQYLRSIEIELERASNHSGDIIKAALRGLDLIFKPGFLYMKCGVTVMDLVPESAIQASFFDTADREKNGLLMKTIDQINQSLGKEILRTAVQGFDRPYRLKTEYLSPRYTTRMGEILKINN
ncbi:MAG TPA: Y-family DNA polymerase [Puia sp.]